MQTIGKYVAAFILALASSYFGPSEADHQKEQEAEIHIRVLHKSPCLTSTNPDIDFGQLS